jgi:hypothetical protein
MKGKNHRDLNLSKKIEPVVFIGDLISFRRHEMPTSWIEQMNQASHENENDSASSWSWTRQTKLLKWQTGIAASGPTAAPFALSQAPHQWRYNDPDHGDDHVNFSLTKQVVGC